MRGGPVDALRALGGTARWKQLRGRVGWRAVKRARAAGTIEVTAGPCLLPRRHRRGPRSRWRRSAVSRSHATAAEHWGFALPPADGLIRLTVPCNAATQGCARPGQAPLPGTSRARRRRRRDQSSADRARLPARREACGSRCRSATRRCDQGRSTSRELGRARSACSARSRFADRARAVRDARCPMAENAFESCARAILLRRASPASSRRCRSGTPERGSVGSTWRDRALGSSSSATASRPTATGGHQQGLIRHTCSSRRGWRPLRFTWNQVMFERSGCWLGSSTRRSAERCQSR